MIGALARRSGDEHLDEPDHDPAILEPSLTHVEQVNRWLGGTRSLIRHIAPFTNRAAKILDIGTGNAAVPRSIARWARRAGRSVRITAADAHPQMIQIARDQSRDFPEIDFARIDARALPYADAAFDVVILVLTLHHFTDDEQIRVLREMQRVAARAIIVSDLERARANYVGALLLSQTLWRTNRLTRHDGPLSVLRSLTKKELTEVAARAGLTNFDVHRHFFFRLVLTAQKQSPQPHGGA